MIEELKRRLLQKPLVPFQIVLKDGRRLSIVRFGQVAMGLTKFTFVSDDYKMKVNSDESQIAGFEPLGEAKASA
jgi:hypothetical protein